MNKIKLGSVLGQDLVLYKHKKYDSGWIRFGRMGGNGHISMFLKPAELKDRDYLRRSTHFDESIFSSDLEFGTFLEYVNLCLSLREAQENLEYGAAGIADSPYTPNKDLAQFLKIELEYLYDQFWSWLINPERFYDTIYTD